MQHLRWVLFLFINLCFTPLTHAEADYWQCSARDSTDKQWTVKSIYSVSANHKALEACKKESAYPKSCIVIESKDCEGFYNGHSLRPSWQCTAIDQMGKAWSNTPAENQDDAAISALSLCKAQSKVPDSCYINSLSCTNVNK